MNLEPKYLHFEAEKLRSDFLPLLVGRVFHFTLQGTMDQIIADGEIRPNHDLTFKSPYGEPGSQCSFFRAKGCVSLFDYRTAHLEKCEFTREPMTNLEWSIEMSSPFTDNSRPPGAEYNSKLAYLFLSPAEYSRLIPWTKWKEEQKWKTLCTAYVEAGYPGPIKLPAIEEVFYVTIHHPYDPLVAAFEKGRKILRSAM